VLRREAETAKIEKVTCAAPGEDGSPVELKARYKHFIGGRIPAEIVYGARKAR